MNVISYFMNDSVCPTPGKWMIGIAASYRRTRKSGQHPRRGVTVRSDDDVVILFSDGPGQSEQSQGPRPKPAPFIPNEQFSNEWMVDEQILVATTRAEVNFIVRILLVPRFHHGSCQNRIADESRLNEQHTSSQTHVAKISGV